MRIKLFRAPEIDGAAQGLTPEQAGTETTIQDPETGEQESTESTEIVPSRELFDDIERRMAEENYDPTDEELAAQDEWIKNGRPEPKEGDAATEIKNEKTEAKDGENPPSNDEGTKKTTEEPATVHTDPVEDTLKLVGAKAPEELHEKVLGLINNSRTQLGQKGTEIKNLSTERDEAVNTNKEFGQFMAGIKQGNPEDVKMLLELAGDLPKHIAKITGGETPKEIEIPEDVIDHTTYKTALGLKEEMKNMFSQLEEKVTGVGSQFQSYQQSQQQQIEAQQQAEAQQKETAELETNTRQLLIDNPDLIPEGEDANALMQEYFQGDPNIPLSTGLKDIHEVVKTYVNAKGVIASLAEAKVLVDARTGRSTQRIIDAQREGRESASKHNLQSGMSEIRQQGNAEQTIGKFTEQEVERMLKGFERPPEDWFDAEDNPLPLDQLPEIVQKVSKRLSGSSY